MYWLTLGSFLFFTGLVALGTWLIVRGRKLDTSEGYFLAGRTLTGGYIAGSLLLTNLSTEQLVGLNGAAYKDGLCVIAWEVVAAMSLTVMALFFLPKYLKSGIATVPDFLEQRFGRTTRTLTSLLLMIAYAAITLPMILYTGATGLNGMLDIETLTGIPSDTGALWFMVWLIGLVGSAYAIFGGLRTVAVSDTLNGFLLLTGGVLITVLALRQVDPNPLAALQELKAAHPAKFNSLGGPQASVPFFTLFTGVALLNLFYWTTNQQIIQRTFAAHSLREGQKGVLIAGVFKALAPLILVLPGLVAFHLYGREIGDKNDHAYGLLVQKVLPPWLAGFFAAVIVGAILSSFNSVLNSTATLFCLDIYKPLLRPQASEQEVVRAGRCVGWIVAFASMTAAPFLAGQDSIFGYLQKMNAIYFIPIFAVMLVGLLTKRVPGVAAEMAIPLGVAVIAVGYFVPVCAVRVEQMHEFHFVGAVFAGLILLMLAIGLVFPRATPWVHEDSGKVDLTPWKPAVPVAIGLILFALAIYAWFADFSVVWK